MRRRASDPAAFTLVEAESAQHFAIAGLLFRDYAAQLGVDLCFQGFESELQVLPLMYGPPSGCLVLVMKGATAVGCGGLRELADGVGEMKRLYIRPAERGVGLARRVALSLLGKAAALGYSAVRLDTLAEMTAARGLYGSLGFREIAAYYDNPLPQSVYMELRLADALTRAGLPV
jgi:ribosomal protein S18 acetylase RimI-like enzyme